MTTIRIDGPIVSKDDAWIYDWIGWDYVCPKAVRDAIESAKPDETIDVYINSSSNENWGDKVCDPIANGSARALSYSEIIGTDTGTFDVGTIDANGMNRDFYGITFFEDDVMEITANGNTAKLVVTHTDGSRDTYDGQCYTD